MENIFGGLVITKGGNHTLLVMDIEVLDDNKLTIGMKSYIQDAINFWWRRVQNIIISIK